ncbi:TPA: DUF2829 domain-containing protein [Stenotrophomonas maltophilia]|uniref:DUF2829 domain-containing protein n=1 Tax=Stenotrophomonas TaxID=40323 RepID=UPI00201CDBC7|nr:MULTISPECIES: DUF2829 domain-containing protein [Stenotrophomonas]MBN5024504.1 DUF2829 domain-containing protein [Stenotrophomonas maltophilia]MDH1274546.1 DUF2829 domain-containing protein [Stenotrophomonas sp. GD03937]MDH1484959.1 DUF2829 domain-containing protein [Stenotrophomonas sp. GD03712]UQY95825.1 DUF2829 domain-containing protein [Stenotrophomonas maltophilia]UQY98111.1 DUF2829 domain-containing protein [Stenotrophomonas maltophilia]
MNEQRTSLPASEFTFGLDFGGALDHLKKGRRLARDGWNGKGMFVYLVPPASYAVQTGAAKAHFGEGSMVPYNAYFAIKNVNDTVSTWVPSVNDCLADDWYVLRDEDVQLPDHPGLG